MRLNLVFVGKTAFPEMETGINRYIGRLRHYIPTEVHVVKAERITAKSSPATLMDHEAERILKLVDKQDRLIVWDRMGRELDSPGLAHLCERMMNEGVPGVWMVVGGPSGVSSILIEQALAVVSLSRMTFPHDLARLMIAEQLYRAFTILKNEPYHR
jgi:23S rRNA (pseudouridine1915-N3)-methyltransferase